MVDPAASTPQRKLALINRWVGAGRVVCLQETHWSAENANTWATLFPGARVCSSPGIRGSTGGIAGGVAVLLPPHFTFVGQRVLIPGYALEVTASNDLGTYRFVSLYLPPGDPTSRLERLEGLLGQGGPPLYMGGDVNLQLYAPRPGEEAQTAHLGELLRHSGTSAVPTDGPTHIGPHQPSDIDILAVPHRVLRT